MELAESTVLTLTSPMVAGMGMITLSRLVRMITS